MSDSYEKDALNALTNELNLPYSLVSTTDSVKELRRRIAFVRRVQVANQPLLDPQSRIDVAKTVLNSLRLEADRNKLLGYLGGRVDTAGHYLADLSVLAPAVTTAAENMERTALQHIDLNNTAAPLTKEEEAYLSKVLNAEVRTSKQYAVISKATTTEGTAIQRRLIGPTTSFDIADAWAAAAVVPATVENYLPYKAAVVPGVLVDRLQVRDPDAVIINVTQLDVPGRLEFAYELAKELSERPTALATAISRAFA